MDNQDSHKIFHNSNLAMTSIGTPLEVFWSEKSSKERFLWIGGVHGDEPEGVELAQQLLAWLQKNNDQVQSSWSLIPCLNVDGYRKNQRTNERGVDLNRNFPTPDWSPEFQKPRYYPGPSAGSEIETQALVQWIEKFQPTCIVHFHSWQPCVVYTGATGKHYAEILGDQKYIAREDIGYPTPGSLGQYGWFVHEIPVICIEEQEHEPLENVWPHFRDGLIHILTQK